MIKVLVADDSAFMRKVITDLFASTNGEFKAVDTARNGKEVVEKVLKLKPDLVTLDINMPLMDGLQALEIIMKDCPVPVVMLSSLTREGSDATIKALSLGAVDFICKPNGSISQIDAIEKEILEKCRIAAKAHIRRPLPGGAPPLPEHTKSGAQVRIALPTKGGLARPSAPPPPSPATHSPLTSILRPTPARNAAPPSAFPSTGRFIVVGCSTGGPVALQKFIPKLPANLPCGVLVVQHMPPGFTASLARRLNELSALNVKEAENHEPIRKGVVYIAPGGSHIAVETKAGVREIVFDPSPPIGTLKPAADILFSSVAKYGKDVVSVILTGMGSDGAKGMEKIKAAGGYVIAEAEETCVVYGMPKAVVDRGLANEVVPIGQVADVTLKALKR